jgi:hypothetical protein
MRVPVFEAVCCAPSTRSAGSITDRPPAGTFSNGQLQSPPENIPSWRKRVQVDCGAGAEVGERARLFSGQPAGGEVFQVPRLDLGHRAPPPPNLE